MDQMLNVGAHSTWGGLQQVVFLKHMVRPSKKVQSCICNPRQNTPNSTLNPQNLGNYDKSSNYVK